MGRKIDMERDNQSRIERGIDRGTLLTCGRARSCIIKREDTPPRKDGQPPGSESLETVNSASTVL